MRLNATVDSNISMIDAPDRVDVRMWASCRGPLTDRSDARHAVVVQKIVIEEKRRNHSRKERIKEAAIQQHLGASCRGSWSGARLAVAGLRIVTEDELRITAAKNA
jgi:hypothetical protein